MSAAIIIKKIDQYSPKILKSPIDQRLSEALVDEALGCLFDLEGPIVANEVQVLVDNWREWPRPKPELHQLRSPCRHKARPRRSSYVLVDLPGIDVRRVEGKVNICEPLTNVVTKNKPKRLERETSSFS